jgi:uncharacterized protein (TIGR02246 family)
MKKLSAVFLGISLALCARALADDPRQAPGREAGRVLSSLQTTARSEDEQAVRASIDAFVQAYQKGDASAIAALFTEDGEAVAPDEETIQGRQALAEHYGSLFSENPGDKLETTIEAIKILAPGVAREMGRTQITPSDGGTPVTSRYTAIHVKRDGKWYIASIRQLPDAELTPADHLKELEWLVGDWVEETPEAVVVTSIAWADNKNFLVRSYDVRVKGRAAITGTQRIGWDPLTKQFKSWVFDDRGGYGEGLWTRRGNQWIVKATGVRADGRTTSATQVLTYVNQDTLRWKSIDRTLGADISLDIDEVTMVRKPPQPK